MTTALCVRCGRPTADGSGCTPCAGHAATQLHILADMAPAARDVAQRQARRGTPSPGSNDGAIPISLSATARLDAVTAKLTTWTRYVSTERGLNPPRPQHLGDDPLTITANSLAGHVEWIRHRPPDDVWEFINDIDACCRVIAGIARGPAELRYLGPCAAPIEPYTDEQGHTRTECPGDVYGRLGAQQGVCNRKDCRATVNATERRAWLDDTVRGYAFRAAQIAHAYGLNPNTIRSWATRGQLVAHGHDTEGRPLFNVGEVLDLARLDVTRRAEQQARRHRQPAQVNAA